MTSAPPPTDPGDDADSLKKDADSLEKLVCYDDFHRVAKARLDPMAYDYYRSGALREWTLAENEKAWQRWVFRRRCLVDVTDVDVGVTVLGQRLSLPIMVGPTAFHRLADP